MLTQAAYSQLSQLIRDGDSPLGVAFSGGGDSTALLSLVCAWAKQNANRQVLALIVDHGLRDGSAQESQLAATRAKALGAQVEILNWVGDKPDTAIQEKARQARYTLMGNACRRRGAKQLLLGHTADDQAETLFMRAQKQSGWRGFCGMWPRKLAPLWPELFEVEVMRPLLNISRQNLRDYNAKLGLEFIDDPSNENPNFARIRARKTLKNMSDVKAQFLNTSMHAQSCLTEEKTKIKAYIGDHVTYYDWGGISFNANSLDAETPLLPQIFKTLIQAVSGQIKNIPEEKLIALTQKLASHTFNGATLGGARFVVKETELYLVRDAGAVLGRNGKLALAPVKIQSGVPHIWDGRFLLKSDQDGLSIAPLMAYTDQLTKAQKQALKAIPEPARAGLPCVLSQGEVVWMFPLPNSEKIEITSLIPTHIDAMSN